MVFCKASIHHWLFRFLDKDFTHAYAVQDWNEYYWVVVQPTCASTTIIHKLKSQYPHIRLLVGPGAKIIKVSADIEPRFRGTLNWFNCVEQIKALLGIRSFWTLTPKQLHDGLIGGRYGDGTNKSKKGGG